MTVLAAAESTVAGARAGTADDGGAARWDREVAAAGGHLLQSWRWGEFKGRHGWGVERLRVEGSDGVGLAQILYRHRGPVAIGYLPRGPVLSSASPRLAERLFVEADEVSRRRRALSLIVEPNERLPFEGSYRRHGFVRGPGQIQPARSVIVPLLEDEALLDQMHQKTRYNIRLAQRRGVTAAQVAATPANVGTFYDLLADTAGRNEFGIHGAAYYADFLDCFGDDAALLFAWIEDRPVAALIVARFAELAIYMYGASSTKLRAHGAGFFLQFGAMRWARGRGCHRYDLWGIPVVEPTTTAIEAGSQVAGTRGEDWRGLYEFKVRFGGRIVGFPPSVERRYAPVLATIARRLTRLGG